MARWKRGNLPPFFYFSFLFFRFYFSFLFETKLLFVSQVTHKTDIYTRHYYRNLVSTTPLMRKLAPSLAASLMSCSARWNSVPLCNRGVLFLEFSHLFLSLFVGSLRAWVAALFAPVLPLLCSLLQLHSLTLVLKVQQGLLVGVCFRHDWLHVGPDQFPLSQ